MAAELYQEFSKNDIPVCSGMPLNRQLEMRDQFHFQACDKNLKQFPAYLAASIELTKSIATLRNAMHCLQAPLAYAKLEETLQHKTSGIKRNRFYPLTTKKSKTS
jgi:hypothetical protein